MDKKQLSFKNGQFKIMLLGDLHEKKDKDELDSKKSADCYGLIRRAIAELEPDLVVYMGDITGAENEENFRTEIGRVVAPCVEADVPFSLVFGNHDRERGVDLETQMKMYQEYDNCYAFDDDTTITGCGCHNLLVKSTDMSKDILNLWFIDSNNLSEDKDSSYYDWVHDDQITWYENKCKKIAKDNDGKVIPAVLFQHIPVPEEYDLLKVANPLEHYRATKGQQRWSDKLYVLKDNVDGYLGEGPCSPCKNNGQFDSWKKMGDVQAAFFGHDHMNDFCGYVDGILLGQCKTAGFKVYTDGCNGGVRLITVNENNVEDIQTRMYYFKKDFKLKSQSLGLYQRHVHDRQDINLKVGSATAGIIAGAVIIGAASKKIYKALKK